MKKVSILLQNQKKDLWREYKYAWDGNKFKQRDFLKMSFKKCFEIVRAQQSAWFSIEKNRFLWFES